ncbi:MAG: GNAT family N-acetyltransferase [Pseudomonadota bacterium]
MSASVRPAIDADLAGIGKVQVQAWHEAYTGILPSAGLARLDPARSAEQWRRVTLSGDTTLTVAQDGPRLLGFGSAQAQRSRMLRDRGFAAEVSSLYLLRAAQGQGLGRALMADMARSLAGWGFASLALWVLADNIPARGFYTHLGGSEVARREDVWAGAKIWEIAMGWPDLRRLMA